jgi:hypothetical protein
MRCLQRVLRFIPAPYSLGVALGIALGASPADAVYIEGQPTEYGAYGEGVLFITTISELPEGAMEDVGLYVPFDGGAGAGEPGAVDPDAWIAWSGVAIDERSEVGAEVEITYDESVLDDPAEDMPLGMEEPLEHLFDPAICGEGVEPIDFDESLIYASGGVQPLSGASGSVPEPATAVYGALAALGWSLRSRRRD